MRSSSLPGPTGCSITSRSCWARCRRRRSGTRREAEAHVIRTTRLFEAAGRHFNRGQRAFFFALGYLGWFVSPWVLLVTTALVVIVTWRRQFVSNAWQAMGN